jgi:uncharacterized protein
MTASPSDDRTVRDNPESHRFEIVVDGAVAGFAEYRHRDGRRSFTHTEIDPAYEGRGLGSTLVRFVLDDARTHGYAVLPYCEFVRGYISEHRSDYLDLVPENERAKFGLD